MYEINYTRIIQVLILLLLLDPDLPLPQFDCSDGEHIPMWKTCNSVPDCSNGKDELVCGSNKGKN